MVCKLATPSAPLPNSFINRLPSWEGVIEPGGAVSDVIVRLNKADGDSMHASWFCTLQLKSRRSCFTKGWVNLKVPFVFRKLTADLNNILSVLDQGQIPGASFAYVLAYILVGNILGCSG